VRTGGGVERRPEGNRLRARGSRGATATRRCRADARLDPARLEPAARGRAGAGPWPGSLAWTSGLQRADRAAQAVHRLLVAPDVPSDPAAIAAAGACDGRNVSASDDHVENRASFSRTGLPRLHLDGRR